MYFLTKHFVQTPPHQARFCAVRAGDPRGAFVRSFPSWHAFLALWVLIPVMALSACQPQHLGGTAQPPADEAGQTAQQGTQQKPRWATRRVEAPGQPSDSQATDKPVSNPRATWSLEELLSRLPGLRRGGTQTPPSDGEQALPDALPAAQGVRVAVLLPLSGTAATLGSAMRDAAQLALFDFPDRRVELLIRDTQGTPEGAARAAQLAIGDGAQLILGPLLAGSVRAVSPQARAANVPVIAFSSDRTVAGGGIYTMGFFPEAEVTRVLDYATSRGAQRFAVLAPDNAYGTTVVAAADRHVALQGGYIAQVKLYDPRADDFSPVVRRLANYDVRHQALLDQRAALKAEDSDFARAALKRLEKVETLGDVDFDALLVADGGKRLQAVAALLPFYDVDPAKVMMLGTGQWDVPGLGAEPALVGGWYAAPPPNARDGFNASFSNVYGETAPRLATLAYDATALALVLSGGGAAGISHAAITQPGGFAGRDGVFRFHADGTVERALAVMQINRRTSQVIAAAPKSFR